MSLRLAEGVEDPYAGDFRSARRLCPEIGALFRSQSMQSEQTGSLSSLPLSAVRGMPQSDASAPSWIK
jgi:hypothetical protein